MIHFFGGLKNRWFEVHRLCVKNLDSLKKKKGFVNQNSL